MMEGREKIRKKEGKKERKENVNLSYHKFGRATVVFHSSDEAILKKKAGKAEKPCRQ